MDGFKKEVDEATLKLREYGAEDSIMLEMGKVVEEKKNTLVKLMEDIRKTKKTIKYLRHVRDRAKLDIDYYFKIPKPSLVAQFYILHKKLDMIPNKYYGHIMKQD